ncbi:hypothetical protein [Ichthyenterobacterium magnum]|nr:hypothetical protein [Ichthyenterobacterium magnum]
MKVISILITMSFVAIISFSDSKAISYKDCKAELSVEKNRSFKSADEDGTQFSLVLTNMSLDSKTFYLSAKSLSEPCDNKAKYNKRGSSTNVDLNVSLNSDNVNKSAINKITLRSGQTYKFKVNVSVPKGTPYNTWSCIEIEAKSKDCESKPEKTILSVFVPDPSEG